MQIVAHNAPVPAALARELARLDEEVMRSDQAYMAEYGLDSLIVMQDVRRTMHERVERAVLFGG